MLKIKGKKASQRVCATNRKTLPGDVIKGNATTSSLATRMPSLDMAAKRDNEACDVDDSELTNIVEPNYSDCHANVRILQTKSTIDTIELIHKKTVLASFNPKGLLTDFDLSELGLSDAGNESIHSGPHGTQKEIRLDIESFLNKLQVLESRHDQKDYETGHNKSAIKHNVQKLKSIITTLHDIGGRDQHGNTNTYFEYEENDFHENVWKANRKEPSAQKLADAEWPPLKSDIEIPHHKTSTGKEILSKYDPKKGCTFQSYEEKQRNVHTPQRQLGDMPAQERRGISHGYNLTQTDNIDWSKIDSGVSTGTSSSFEPGTNHKIVSENYLKNDAPSRNQLNDNREMWQSSLLPNLPQPMETRDERKRYDIPLKIWIPEETEEAQIQLYHSHLKDRRQYLQNIHSPVTPDWDRMKLYPKLPSPGHGHKRSLLKEEMIFRDNTSQQNSSHCPLQSNQSLQMLISELWQNTTPEQGSPSPQDKEFQRFRRDIPSRQFEERDQTDNFPNQQTPSGQEQDKSPNRRIQGTSEDIQLNWETQSQKDQGYQQKQNQSNLQSEIQRRLQITGSISEHQMEKWGKGPQNEKGDYKHVQLQSNVERDWANYQNPEHDQRKTDQRSTQQLLVLPHNKESLDATQNQEVEQPIVTPQDVRARLQQQLEEKQREIQIQQRMQRQSKIRGDGPRRGSLERLHATINAYQGRQLVQANPSNLPTSLEQWRQRLPSQTKFGNARNNQNADDSKQEHQNVNTASSDGGSYFSDSSIKPRQQTESWQPSQTHLSQDPRQPVNPRYKYAPFSSFASFTSSKLTTQGGMTLSSIDTAPSKFHGNEYTEGSASSNVTQEADGNDNYLKYSSGDHCAAGRFEKNADSTECGVNLKDNVTELNNQNIIVCPNCQNNSVWPHVLHCFHTFCFKCLASRYDKAQGEIICPACSWSTSVGNGGPFELNIDLTLCSVLFRFENPFPCTVCPGKGNCHVYCIECMQFLCAKCRLQHTEMPDASSHNLESINRYEWVNGKFIELCSLHQNRIADIFCSDCRKMICFVCKNSLHSYHTIIKDVERVKRRIRTITSDVERMLDITRKRILPINMKKQEIEFDARACQRNVHAFSNMVIDAVDQMKSEGRAALDGVTKERTVVGMKIMEDLVQEYSDDYKSLKSVTNMYLKNPTPSILMPVAGSLIERFKNLDTMYEKIKKFDSYVNVDLNFSPDYPAVTDALNQSYQVEIVETLSDIINEDRELGRLLRRNMEEILSRGSTNADSQKKAECSDRANLFPWAIPNDCEDDEIYRRPVDSFHSFSVLEHGASKSSEKYEPSGVVYLSDESLAVCDARNHRILIFDKNYEYVRTIGQPPAVSKTSHEENARQARVQGSLYFPYKLAQCPKTKNIVVIERPPSRAIQIFDIYGNFIRRFGNCVLQHPRGVTVDEEGIVLVIEGKTMRLMLFNQEGVNLNTFHLVVHLEFPNDIAAKDGIIYICDNRGHKVRVFDYNGRYRGSIGYESATHYPIGVSINSNDDVVITDNHNTFNISVFSKDGTYRYGYKSNVKHANCFNVALHPSRYELAVTSKDNLVILFKYTPF